MGSTTVTEEEEKMLAEEGIYLPIDMPLTKVKMCLTVCGELCITWYYRLKRNI